MTTATAHTAHNHNHYEDLCASCDKPWSESALCDDCTTDIETASEWRKHRNGAGNWMWNR